MNERMETILKDADQLLLRSAAQYQETEEYRLLVRCLDEQTIAGSGGRRLRKKGEESPSTTSLQNPTDPDATYCVKGRERPYWVCCECGGECGQQRFRDYGLSI